MELEVLVQSPAGAPRATPLLFVHGAWHAAWCWENFLPYFADQGYAAYALSLRGHGGSAGRAQIRWHSAARGYVADVAAVVAQLPAPPVLIGHSMGGYVVQKYLEAHAAPAAVLLASVPVRGIIGFGVRQLLHHPRSFLKSQLLLDPWHIIATPELARDALFSADLPEAELARHFARLQGESLRFELESLALSLPRPRADPAPMLVLGAENDRIFSVAEARATARAYGTAAEIFPGMAHDMMLERGWRSVADRIRAWLAERGL
jgi:pimeloyl-ACP methyl ester carboxylesterase